MIRGLNIPSEEGMRVLARFMIDKGHICFGVLDGSLV